MKRMAIPVESQIDIYDPSYVWYPIKGYPGYECCIINKGMIIRSLKSIHAHPYGTLVRLYDSNFILTNKDNQRIKITPEKVYDLLDKSLPRQTTTVDQFKARNNRAFINPDAKSNDGTIVDKPRSIRKDDQELFYPKFNIQHNLYD